jgi:hypothetical protein
MSDLLEFILDSVIATICIIAVLYMLYLLTDVGHWIIFETIKEIKNEGNFKF